MSDKEHTQLIKELLQRAEELLHQAQELLAAEIEGERVVETVPAPEPTAVSDVPSTPSLSDVSDMTNTTNLTNMSIMSKPSEAPWDGFFEGGQVVSEDGKTYPITAEFSLNNSLVVGDKLRVSPPIGEGDSTVKLTERVKKRFLPGKIVVEDGEYSVRTNEGSFHVLREAVQKLGLSEGQEATAVLPKSWPGKVTFAGLEKAQERRQEQAPSQGQRGQEGERGRRERRGEEGRGRRDGERPRENRGDRREMPRRAEDVPAPRVDETASTTDANDPGRILEDDDLR